MVNVKDKRRGIVEFIIINNLTHKAEDSFSLSRSLSRSAAAWLIGAALVTHTLPVNVVFCLDLAAMGLGFVLMGARAL